MAIVLPPLSPSPSPNLSRGPVQNAYGSPVKPVQNAYASPVKSYGTPSLRHTSSPVSAGTAPRCVTQDSLPLSPLIRHPQASFHIAGEGICPPPELPHNVSQEQIKIETKFLDGAGGGGSECLPWLGPNAVASRRATMGLNEIEVDKFMQDTEFVGLGCFCGVTRALQALGVKRFSYPFDWVRSNVPAVICCLQTNFEDFSSYSFVGEGPAPGIVLYGGAKWGGSFWHHDPRDAEVQSSFDRRIERLQGKAEIARDATRVFCVSLNSLTDISLVPQLRYCLEQMLPNADIFMLVYMDNQPAQGLVRITDEDSRSLLYWVHEEMFNEMGKTWSEQKHSEAYAEGLAMALRVWAGIDSYEAIPEVSSYVELWNRCNNFESGDPGEKLYWPLRVPKDAMPIMPSPQRRRRTEGCDRSLPWPFDVILQPCGADFEEEDDTEIRTDTVIRSQSFNRVFCA